MTTQRPRAHGNLSPPMRGEVTGNLLAFTKQLNQTRLKRFSRWFDQPI